MKGLIIFFLLLVSQYNFAQIGLEEWREHLPYSKTIAVSEGDQGRIYCATPYSVFYYDKNEDAIVRMSTITGLSDVRVSTIAYDEGSKQLIIAYENANIDLIHKGKIINLSDIKRKPIVGSKRINRILCHNKLIYFACDFGIVVVDPKKREIKETFYIGPEGKSISVMDLDCDDSLFYAATSEGIYHAAVDGKNLNDYASWNLDTTAPYPTGAYNCISAHSSGLYVNIPGNVYNTDTIFVKKDGEWSAFEEISNMPTWVIKDFGDTLVFAQDYSFKYFYNNMTESFLAYTYGEESPRAADIIFDKKGEAWIADQEKALVHSPGKWKYRFITPKGPAAINAYSMTWNQGQLWVASGGVKSNWSAAYVKKGIYQFKDQEWTSLNKSNTAVFDSVLDPMKIVVNPANSQEIFIATWGEGIVQMRNNTVVNVFDDKNSSLSQASNYPGFIGVGGLAYDANNYLWATNTNTSNALCFRKPDGTWQSLSLSPFITTQEIGGLIIDDWGQKWIIFPRGNGIIVYNDNNTPESRFDDRKKQLSTADNNGKLPSSGINCLAKDKEGSIWVGTDEGVAVFYSPELVFSGNNFDAQQIYVEQEGISQYLLESEVVTAIAIDGANRKWFGTRNAGVFLMSDDADEQIYHFTEENSPLLSNNIYSIAIDDNSGEVFFGTENGIISFRSTATEGTKTQGSNVTVFPNPVRPEYNGKIAINGLVENANVKITDTYGNLVFETIAYGGQAIWNGKNFNGERVATGVYYVFSTDDNNEMAGEETIVTKILFIN